MPSSRASNPLNYNDVRLFYGGGLPARASDWRNRDGSWAWGAMTGSADTYRVRGRPRFNSRPGSERIQFWFYSAGWYIRFNPTLPPYPRTDYGLSINTVTYYYGNSTSASYPSQFSSVWSSSNVMRWFGGRRYYFMQAHNSVSGYRTTLGYYWYISDERLKTNIKYVGDVNGHRTYTWEWNELANSLGVRGISSGVLAQEVKKYMPEAIVMNSNGYYQVNYRMLGLR